MVGIPASLGVVRSTMKAEAVAAVDRIKIRPLISKIRYLFVFMVSSLSR
jgi:hypothetical protein